MAGETAVPMACRACAKPIAPYDGHMMVMRYRVGDSGVDHFCSGSCVRAYMAPEQERVTSDATPEVIPRCHAETTVRDDEHKTYQCLLPRGHHGSHESGDITVEWTDETTRPRLVPNTPDQKFMQAVAHYVNEWRDDVSEAWHGASHIRSLAAEPVSADAPPPRENCLAHAKHVPSCAVCRAMLASAAPSDPVTTLSVVRQQQYEERQRRERATPDAWSDGRDKPLPEDERIKEAHPVRSGDHEKYAEASRFVGAKHSKYALIALVNWLLHRAEPPICEVCGEEHNPQKVYGEVEICRSCYMACEHAIDVAKEENAKLRAIVDAAMSMYAACPADPDTTLKYEAAVDTFVDALAAAGLRMPASLPSSCDPKGEP